MGTSLKEKWLIKRWQKARHRAQLAEIQRDAMASMWQEFVEKEKEERTEKQRALVLLKVMNDRMQEIRNILRLTDPQTPDTVSAVRQLVDYIATVTGEASLPHAASAESNSPPGSEGSTSSPAPSADDGDAPR